MPLFLHNSGVLEAVRAEATVGTKPFSQRRVGGVDIGVFPKDRAVCDNDGNV